MTKLLSPLLLAAAPALGVTAASAEQPAAIRGVVYACETRQPMAHAHVVLRGVDDGSVLRLRSDANGRFSMVGVTPGRWNIQAGQSGDILQASTRQAMLESGDVLDMVIGVHTSGATRSMAANPQAAHTDCDPFRVPPAPSPSDRYIIH